MVKRFFSAIFLLGVLSLSQQEDINLPDLDPQDAQQIIEQQDNTLKYAPKIESNVPAVRYLGNEPHNVVEDIYLANQYHGQDGLGGYLYGYSVPDISKTEKKKAGGDLRGAYNYIAGNGQEIKVEYWDDGTGFHQIDNVPKNLPEDLPAVKAEKERFLKRWHEEAERNSRPVEDPYNSEGQYKAGPLSPQGQLQRQQQFAAQFGKSAAYKQPQGAASQQSAIYQSNLEKSQPYSSNYQPYQGKDQQNQGAYKSEKLTALPKGPQAATGYGQTSGGYGAQPSGGYGAQPSGGYGSTGGYGAQPSGGYGSTGGYGAQPSGGYGSTGGYGAQPSGGYGSTSGGQSGYGAQKPVVSSGYGGQSNTGYGGSTGGYGTQTSAPAYGRPSSSGYGAQTGYGSQPASSGSAYGGQGSSGYGAKPSGGGSGYGGQTTTGYGGSGGYVARPTGGYGGSSGYGQLSQPSGGYIGQSSQTVNKYAAYQTSPSGQASETHSKYISNQEEEDDGSYKPGKDEEQGPPRGFFYKFDYPVGIIVSKQGPVQGGSYGQGGYQDQQKKIGSY